jgi:chromosome segregation ATPase
MCEPITNGELAEIKKRAEKATEGEWINVDGGYVITLDGTHPEGYGESVADVYGENDAEFIAHARQDIPKLLEEIEYLRKEVENRDAEIDRIEYVEDDLTEDIADLVLDIEDKNSIIEELESTLNSEMEYTRALKAELEEIW